MKKTIIIAVAIVVVGIAAILAFKPKPTPEQVAAKLARQEARYEQRMESERLHAEIEASKPESVRIQESKDETAQQLISTGSTLLMVHMLTR